MCLSGCGEGGPDEVLPLRIHSAPGCDLATGAEPQDLELLALGDFEAGNESVELLRLDARGADLAFPAATRAVVAHVAEERAFFGYGERDSRGLDLLLWPKDEACSLFRPDGAQGYPGRRGGQALAFVEGTTLVVAAGGNDPLVSDAIVGTLTFDASRGSVRAADTSEPGVLREPRAFATLTRFGDRLVMAGGETPVFGVPEQDIEPQGSAEVFDPAHGRAVGEPIALRSRRTRHAAVVLDDGRTLLVGGRSQVGGSSLAQYQLETLDPETNHADVAGSIVARIAPTALKLTDGRVFVGGGVDLEDQLVEPVAEWLSREAKADATRLDVDVAPRFERAFVATLGGGVLAVGGCAARAPRDDEDRRACEARCSRGCPPLDAEGAPSYDAWWIDRTGGATPVDMTDISAPRPLLLPGSDASPWLIAATLAAPGIPRLFRFNPWAARFLLADAPEGLRLPRPGFPTPVVVAPDTFVWLDDDEQHGELVGLRLGTRNRYAQDVALVLLTDPLEPRKPVHLAPDAPIGSSVSYAPGQLGLRSPEVTVHVTDTDYRDVTVTLRLLDDALPVVLLGDTELGGDECPWPGAGFIPPDWPKIVRRGPRAELYVGGRSRSCDVGDGRLSLGLRAGSRPSRLSELEVKRSLSP